MNATAALAPAGSTPKAAAGAVNRGKTPHERGRRALAVRWEAASVTHASYLTTSLSEEDISRIVEMAWEDRTSFEAIEAQFALNESAVTDLMRSHMKPSSFRLWRKRMAGRTTKHAALRGAVHLRHCASHRRP